MLTNIVEFIIFTYENLINYSHIIIDKKFFFVLGILKTKTNFINYAMNINELKKRKIFTL